MSEHHFVILYGDRWSVEHPTDCHPDLAGCLVTQEVERRYTAEVEASILPGRYRVASLDPWVLDMSNDQGVPL